MFRRNASSKFRAPWNNSFEIESSPEDMFRWDRESYLRAVLLLTNFSFLQILLVVVAKPERVITQRTIMVAETYDLSAWESISAVPAAVGLCHYMPLIIDCPASITDESEMEAGIESTARNRAGTYI
ncbi:hypothetical protein NL676_019142 [Syzygium grande]|nr:hypothetical protein NL676_019142 [Syzygium grande]